MESQVQVFFDMMRTCYGVHGWLYDGQLNLQYTSSTSPNLQKMLLFGFGRDQVILTHARESSIPLIVSDDLGLMWGIVGKRDEKAAQPVSIHVLGPVIHKEFTTQMMEQLLIPYDLSVQKKWHLISELQRIPKLTTIIFFQQIIALHYYVNAVKVRISDFDYYAPQREGEGLRKIEICPEVPHAVPMVEKRLLDMVRTGNLEYHAALTDAGAVSPGVRVKTADPIRQAKYSVVAFITLCTRAAIEGGMSAELAYTLNDTYIQSVDQARTVSQVAAVSHTMYEDFIRRVNQVRRESGISRPVRICCDYIDTHPETELTLKSLAQRVGYTENYLARKFKAETGMPISAYVRKARVHRAKMLLSSTNLSIHDISVRLHFCSWSYFTEAFQKEVGRTPSEYRRKENEIDSKTV